MILGHQRGPCASSDRPATEALRIIAFTDHRSRKSKSLVPVRRNYLMTIKRSRKAKKNVLPRSLRQRNG